MIRIAKKLLLSFVITALLSASSYAQTSDLHHLEVYLGISNPKPGKALAAVYNHKSIQPRLGLEYPFYKLGYSKTLAVKFSVIAGLDPASFDNKSHIVDYEFTVLKTTAHPLGGRIYPLDMRKNIGDMKLTGKTPLTEMILLWLARGIYVEAGFSPATKLKEAGYADVTRTPTFFGYGINLIDFEDDHSTRFRFAIGQRKYSWSNASNTTSQIKSFSLDFGLSFKL